MTVMTRPAKTFELLPATEGAFVGSIAVSCMNGSMICTLVAVKHGTLGTSDAGNVIESCNGLRPDLQGVPPQRRL